MGYDGHPPKIVGLFDFLIILDWIIAILVVFHAFGGVWTRFGAQGTQEKAEGMGYDGHPPKIVGLFDFLIILDWIIAILVVFHVFGGIWTRFGAQGTQEKAEGMGYDGHPPKIVR
jgi:succinate dehydrogenase/fumarate reductase cytochrome b subunit